MSEEIPGGTIYRSQRSDDPSVIDVMYVREPEKAGPMWHAIVMRPKKASGDGSIIPSQIIVKPEVDAQCGARRLAEVCDWLTALYQLAEEQDAKYPNGYEAPAAEKPKRNKK